MKRVIRLIFNPVKWALLASLLSGTVIPRHFGFILRSQIEPNHLCHRVAGEPLSIRVLGVAGNLFERDVAADRHDLVGRATGLGESSACCLAQPVRHAPLRQSGRVAPLSKLRAEIVASEGPAGVRDEERLDADGRGAVEHRLQVRMHRNRHRVAGLVLFYPDEHAVLDVPDAHANYIAATLRGVEQQCEREPLA